MNSYMQQTGQPTRNEWSFKDHAIFKTESCINRKIWLDWSLVQDLKLIKTSKNKNPRLDNFTGEFYQTFFKHRLWSLPRRLIPILFRSLWKIEEEGTLPNSFCELGQPYLIPKPDKDHTRKLQISIYEWM